VSDERPKVYYALARAVLAAMPFGGSVDILVEHTRKSLEYKARQTIGEIVDVTGVEELAERLASEPEVEAIFVQGLETAMRTGHEGKRRLLARLISAAVLDDAKVDEGLLFVLALRNLDGPHLRALEAMIRAAEKVNAEGLVADERGYGPSASERHANSIAAQVTNDLARTPLSVCAGLVREGLIRKRVNKDVRDRDRDNWENHEVTSFGRALLEHLREVDVG
jgi:hypothetical protein